MKTFKNYLRLAAAIGVLSFTLLLTNADWVRAQTSKVVDVFVTNGPANPVPTRAQGTTTVEGTVSAAQSGPWNVDINGMPNVNASQAGTWNVALNGIPDVSIANPVSLDRGGVPGLPIFVNDMASPAMQPFQTSTRVTLFDGENFKDAAMAQQVPTGKRLIVEHVSVLAVVPPGQKANCFVVVLEPVNLFQILAHALPVNLQGSFPSGFGFNQDFFQASQPIRMYADHSNTNSPTIHFGAARNAITGGAASFDFNLSGYLVDVP